MSVVATWKNGSFALPKCDPVRFISVEKPTIDFDPGCICFAPKATQVFEDVHIPCGCTCSGGFGGGTICNGDHILTRIALIGDGSEVLPGVPSNYTVVGDPYPSFMQYNIFGAPLYSFHHNGNNYIGNDYASGSVGYVGEVEGYHSFEGNITLPDGSSVGVFLKAVDSDDRTDGAILAGGTFQDEEGCGFHVIVKKVNFQGAGWLFNPGGLHNFPIPESGTLYEMWIGPSPCCIDTDFLQYEEQCCFCNESWKCVPQILYSPPRKYSISGLHVKIVTGPDTKTVAFIGSGGGFNSHPGCTASVWSPYGNEGIATKICPVSGFDNDIEGPIEPQFWQTSQRICENGDTAFPIGGLRWRHEERCTPTTPEDCRLTSTSSIEASTIINVVGNYTGLTVSAGHNSVYRVEYNPRTHRILTGDPLPPLPQHQVEACYAYCSFIGVLSNRASFYPILPLWQINPWGTIEMQISPWARPSVPIEGASPAVIISEENITLTYEPPA